MTDMFSSQDQGGRNRPSMPGRPEQAIIDDFTGDEKADWLLHKAQYAKGRQRWPLVKGAAYRIGELQAELAPNPTQPLLQWSALNEVCNRNGLGVGGSRLLLNSLVRREVNRGFRARSAEVASPIVAKAIGRIARDLQADPAFRLDPGDFLGTLMGSAEDMARSTNLPMTTIFAEVAHAANLSREEIKRAWPPIKRLVRMHRDEREAKRSVSNAKALDLPADYLNVVSLKKSAPRLLTDPFAATTTPPGPTVFEWIEPEKIARRDWLYGLHLIRKELAATVAPGGVGKTSLMIAEALAMVSGKPLLGVMPKVRCKVWLWNGEEPVEEMQRRIMAACRHFGLSRHDIDGRLFVDTADTMTLVMAEETKDGTRINTPLVDQLATWLADREIDALFVDPFISTHNVNENDNNAIQKAATAWKEVARKANVAIGAAHHTRKLQEGRSATAEDSRGAKAFTDKCRVVRALAPMGVSEAEKFGLKPADRRGYFCFDPGEGKSNMSPATGSKVWFQTVPVMLGNGRGNLDLGDQVAVVAPWKPTTVRSELSAARVESLRAILSRANWRSAPQAAKSPDWVGAAVAEAFGIDQAAEGWQEAAKRIVRELERAGVLVRATVRDARRHEVPVFVFGKAPSPDEAGSEGGE